MGNKMKKLISFFLCLLLLPLAFCGEAQGADVKITLKPIIEESDNGLVEIAFRVEDFPYQLIAAKVSFTFTGSMKYKNAYINENSLEGYHFYSITDRDRANDTGRLQVVVAPKKTETASLLVPQNKTWFTLAFEGAKDSNLRVTLDVSPTADGKTATVFEVYNSTTHAINKAVTTGVVQPEYPPEKEEPTPTKKPSTGGGGGGGGGGVSIPKPSVSAEPTQTSAPTKAPQEQKDEKAENAEMFTDMDGFGWAEDAVRRLAESGVLKGTGEGTFSPRENVKRADFLLILTRAFGLSAEATDNFDDVLPGSYYYDAVGACKALGIAQGAQNQFRPEENISRQDLVTLVYRALEQTGFSTEKFAKADLSGFDDYGQIADYAKPALEVLCGMGAITGRDGNLVAPEDAATRAETAVICDRILNKLNLQ